jgi:hypothetical protein
MIENNTIFLLSIIDHRDTLLTGNEIIEFGDVGVVVVGATDGVFGTPHIFDSHLLLHK